MLTDDSAIRALNREWRGKNAPTNVLSFPARGRAKPVRVPIYRRHRHRLSRPSRARRPPKASRSTIISRISPSMDFSICSATITTNDRERGTMERLERKILKRLAIPDPYARNLSRIMPDDLTRPAVRLSRPAARTSRATCRCRSPPGATPRATASSRGSRARCSAGRTARPAPTSKWCSRRRAPAKPASRRKSAP